MSKSSVYRPTTPYSRHSSEASAPQRYGPRRHSSAPPQADIRFSDMDAHHWLSNTYPAAIQYDHKTYPTAVHLYQALKFVDDPDIMRVIRHAESPKEACSLSRAYASWCDPEWRHGRNVKEMERVLSRKFDQHSDLKRKLLNTGDREIIVESDSFWGVDTTGKGQNELGLALMRLRDRLREHSHGLLSRSQHAPGVSPLPTSRDTIYFNSKRNPYKEFTNSSEHSVRYNGKRYPTGEHLFQAMKFLNDPSNAIIVDKIRRSANTKAAFQVAKKHSDHVRADWSQVRIRKMKEVIFLKFVQHETLIQKLLGTGSARLVADFDKDDFWGCGRSERGRNELGKALMALRAYLRDPTKKLKQTQ